MFAAIFILFALLASLSVLGAVSEIIMRILDQRARKANHTVNTLRNAA